MSVFFEIHYASHHCITANLFIFYARLASYLGAIIAMGLVQCLPALLQMFPYSVKSSIFKFQLNVDTNAGEVMTF